MPYSGQGKRGVLIVAEAPGKTEDETGTQLVGKAGKLLRQRLAAIGVDLDRDCWKTNALICRPDGNRTPTPDEVGHCLPNLMNTINATNPRVIIPLGGVALSAVIGRLWQDEVGAIGTWAGFRIPTHKWDAWVCPSWHPSFLLRQEDAALNLWFDKHLTAAFELEGRPWPDGPPDFRKQVECIIDPNKAAVIIREMIKRGGLCSFDYETNMLKPDGPDARIVACSICWRGKKTIAYPWLGDAITATQEFLKSPLPKVGANVKFEDRWTRRIFGHRVRGWAWDDNLGAHLADNRPGITSIKFQSFVRYGLPIWNKHIEPFLKSKGTREANQVLREIDIQDLLLYCGLDSLMEYLVGVDQMRELNYDHNTFGTFD